MTLGGLLVYDDTSAMGIETEPWLRSWGLGGLFSLVKGAVFREDKYDFGII